MGYTIKEMISQEKLEGRIKELGAQISKDYEGKSVHLICILKGSAFFACELAKDLDETITGKNVIVIEDIIDTGRTLSHLVTLLKHRDPASLVLCTLLDKPERRVVDDVNVDYVGFQIPDEFVVGYGLDYAQNHRNLSYIGVVEFDS
ncbi:MAG: hypoxanthine phosphoribosyltransferase [Lachnospiraceae bacterium]|nr:hypoxanthine phosphoribosyltransferase [Lachnospiraceae bacterium]